jgi:signal transduction histidine kinase
MKLHFMAWSRSLATYSLWWIAPAVAAPVLAGLAASMAAVGAPGVFPAWAALVGGLAATLIQAFPRASDALRGALGVAAAALLQFAVAVSAVRGGPVASGIASVFLVALGGLHGVQLQVSPSHPYGALAGLVALAAAAAVVDTTGELGLLVVAGMAALGAALGSGLLRRRAGAFRTENEALRAAIHAHVLQRETRDDGRYGAQMRELLDTAHAASRATIGALMDFELLDEGDSHASGYGGALREAQGMSAELGKVLSRMSEVVDGRRDLASDDGPAIERVDVSAALRRACRSVGSAHPAVELVLDDGGASDDLRVPVRDGERALGSVFRHVIANACEGDGTTTPTRVEVRLARWGNHGVMVECSDDGPGFPYVQLRSGSPFRTTKRGHLGLGLYVSETLLAASGGSLQRANLPGTGALVRLHLRRR